ncbi:MAG: hypothetical protein ABJC19_04840 [Gemmatimonadota bacterium]
MSAATLMAGMTPLPAQTATDSILHANAVVQARVTTMQGKWVTGRLVRSTSALGCLAIMVEAEPPAGRVRFVFLHAVDSLRVDQRTNSGVMALQLGPAEASDWYVLPRRALRAANAGCTGRRQ